MALATMSIPALTDGFQSVLTRSMENTASSAVNGVPLENDTPSRSWKV